MQRTEIARVQTTESDRIVNYIITLEYTPAETDPDDGYVTPAEWVMRMLRRHEADGDRFDDRHGTVTAWLCDVEDRMPTVQDVTEDRWNELLTEAACAIGWESWGSCIASSRLTVRLLQEAGVP